MILVCHHIKTSANVLKFNIYNIKPVACTYHYHPQRCSVKPNLQHFAILLFWAFFMGFIFSVFLLFQDHLSHRNSVLPHDRTSDPWITNPMLWASILILKHLNISTKVLCQGPHIIKEFICHYYWNTVNPIIFAMF